MGKRCDEDCFHCPYPDCVMTLREIGEELPRMEQTPEEQREERRRQRARERYRKLKDDPGYREQARNRARRWYRANRETVLERVRQRTGGTARRPAAQPEELEQAAAELRTRRRALGLRIKELAAAAEVTPDTAGRWERGLYPVPARAWAALEQLEQERKGGTKRGE